ncbi:MAG: hypothetical protein RKO25_11340 [Candidatus Contendobacter sp.]|nr:hypothetical protein [Candidatus Contendobacter sp.]
MKIRIWLVLIGLLALALVGCRSNPVYNVEGTPISTSTSGYSLRDVRDAIQQAGVSLGWQMQDVKPGLIVGTLYLRDHMAQVEIPYSRSSYSILYKDSQNLNYDGANIHSNYNGWVQRLNGAINAQLSRL